ncbi:LPXTG cell wall anchor domain-containing protein [Nocardiopsis sp. EMB25]|uniref:LPXTG cell wall anchor domain-containing protein n=1 Tax=Nocardiopsis sp. EMB25 TaxID=2835867 RepID=UPI0022853485|nr:LPXTG cell wall anchor domain-containing protein [Nocardiopsis sp. EMB25]MCY9786202.1 LPXTG cell wall anchor domain-containing protein [Nocardiopsis sp. EMB25]
MKNTARFAARRIVQGGATFAALGALTVATAVPANAGVYQYGWAYADIADGHGVASTAVAFEDSASNSFSGAVEDYLTIDAETSATVDASGAQATTVVNSARIQVTADDLERILDENEDDEDSEPEEPVEPSDPASPEPPEGPDRGNGDSEGDGATGDGGSGAPENDGDADAPSDQPTEPGGQPSDEPAPSDSDSQEPAPEPTAIPESSPGATGDANESVQLDEENTELTASGEELVLDATITGMTVTTTQTWGGEVTHSFEPGDLTVDVSTHASSIGVGHSEQTWEVEEEGLHWYDAYTAGGVSVSVAGVLEFEYPLGEAIASVTEEMYEGTDGDGDGNGDDNGNSGDDKNPPAEREVPEEKPKQRSVEPLAQTGSPVVGLIAAGAAVAAGGGLAAFFARRRKTAAAADESSEG